MKNYDLRVLLMSSAILAPTLSEAKLCMNARNVWGEPSTLEHYHTEEIPLGPGYQVIRCTQHSDSKEICQKVTQFHEKKVLQDRIDVANRVVRLHPLRQMISTGTGIAGGAMGAVILGAPVVLAGAALHESIRVGNPTPTLEEARTRGAIAGAIASSPLGAINIVSGGYTGHRAAEIVRAPQHLAQQVLTAGRNPALLEAKNSACTWIKEEYGNLNPYQMDNAIKELTNKYDGKLDLISVFDDSYKEQTTILMASVLGPIGSFAIDLATGNLPGHRNPENAWVPTINHRRFKVLDEKIEGPKNSEAKASQADSK